MKKVGLFGGTFNPIHNGHLNLAKNVQELFKLDLIYFIPAALPPHKNSTNLTDFQNRFEMICLAISKSNGFRISDVEMARSGISYTIDTVRYFKSTFPENYQFFLLMGVDAVFEINTWKSFQDLLKLIPFIVMIRPETDIDGTNIKKRPFSWAKLTDYLKTNISDGYNFSEKTFCYHHKNRPSIFTCNISPQNISSSNIRELIRKKKAFQHLLPKKVADYIKAKGLYL